MERGDSSSGLLATTIDIIRIQFSLLEIDFSKMDIQVNEPIETTSKTAKIYLFIVVFT